MKPSRYNHTIEQDDQIFLYNALSGGLVAADKNIAASLKSARLSSLTDNMIHNLAAGGFLLPLETDELQVYRHQWYRAQHEWFNAGLTISPTMSCNMKCTYCLAHRDQLTMSGATADKVISFVADWMKPAQSLVINWFGGEPLLALDIVEYINRNLIALADNSGYQFASAMYTNAYELTPDVTDKLHDLRINNIIVAVDGPQHVHEQRRPHISGHASFQRILNNVVSAADKLQISLQCIVDAQNKDSAWELFDTLDRQGMLSDNIRFRIGRMDCDVVAERVSKQHELTRTQFDRAYIANLRRRLGHPRLHVPYPYPYMNCHYQRFSVLSIDPDGDIYKCVKAVGRKQWAVGSVEDPPVLTTPRMAPWISLDPCLRDSCRECSYLPICSGGCAYVYVSTGTSRCQSYRWMLDEWIKLYIEWRRYSHETASLSLQSSP